MHAFDRNGCWVQPVTRDEIERSPFVPICDRAAVVKYRRELRWRYWRRLWAKARDAMAGVGR